jgi:hypothetical protein
MNLLLFLFPGSLMVAKRVTKPNHVATVTNPLNCNLVHESESHFENFGILKVMFFVILGKNPTNERSFYFFL